MNEHLCVYTCITGDYDNLHEIEHPEKNIDYYCFTNNKKLRSKTWKIILIENEGLDNCRLARKIKILGHPCINNHYDIAVWTDADVIWQKPISEFVAKYLKDTPLAIFRHHARNNIHDEAVACLVFRKDTKENIQRTLNFYESISYPDNNGLCESTVFIKKPRDPKVIETMEIWFSMIKNYSRRDQLSFNYAIWKTQLKVHYIGLNVWNNPWFNTVKHTPNHEIKDCHIYFGDPTKNFDFNNYQIHKYQKTDNTYRLSFTIPHNVTEIEFAPTDIIGLTYQSLAISPTPTKIVFSGTTTLNKAIISCVNHSTFRIYGKFEEKQTVTISIEMLILERRADIDKLIESQYLQNNRLSEENSKLTSENRSLLKIRDDFQKVINSKGWQTLEKLRKIKTLFRH